MSRSNTLSSDPCAVVKIHESLFIWLGSSMLWHAVFSTYGTDIANAEYLQWGATAFTVVLVTKFVVSRKHCSFSAFLGAPINRSSLCEISLVTAMAIVLGIGFWTVLVLIEARIDADWTYRWWGLVTPAQFEGIRWVKSWIFIDAISGVILVPITEEIIFRGLILRRLMSKYDTWAAVSLSSLLFSLFHTNKSFVGSFFHAVLFAVLAVKFASLYAPILVHGAYNLFAFVAQTSFGTFLVADKLKIGSIGYWAPELMCLALGVALFAAYIARTSRSFSEQPIKVFAGSNCV